MKRLFLLLIFTLHMFIASIYAQQIEFKFAAGTIYAEPLKTRMENNISALLTEINRAGNDSTALNLSGINIKPEAKVHLNALWNEAAQFVCDKQANISKCLNDFQGYQVRAIPITIKPVDSFYNQSLNRELTISLDKSGVITGVFLSLERQEDVSKIQPSPGGEADTHKRREILKWIECYQSYYYERNIQAIAQLFNDVNALIVTDGRLNAYKQKDKDAKATESKTKYKTDTWGSYIKKLSHVFSLNQRLEFEIDHISVVKHGAKPNIYGVTFHQKWQTDSYSDAGWIFLLWGFNGPEKPMIHIKTWQPDQAAAKDGVFGLDDFITP